MMPRRLCFQNVASQDSSNISNFENLGKLLVELQTYGYPPKELTGELPAGNISSPT